MFISPDGYRNTLSAVVIVVALIIVALLRLCWCFLTVALAQPPESTSVCLKTSELIKNGFGQVDFELNRQGFFFFFVSRVPLMKYS